MSKKIIIVKNNKINKLFVKANNYIMTHNKTDILQSNDKHNALKLLYKKLFNATLVDNKGTFTEILFDKDKDYTVFLLRFD